MEVFSDRKTSKNINKFVCLECDFSCCKKGDWIVDNHGDVQSGTVSLKRVLPALNRIDRSVLFLSQELHSSALTGWRIVLPDETPPTI